MSVPPLDTIKSCQPNPLNQNCDFRGTRLHCFLPPQRRLAYLLFNRFPLSCPFISPSPLAGQRGPHISPRDSCPNKPLHSLWPLEGERQLTIHFHQSICALLELTLNTGDTLASHWSPDEYIILRMPGKGWEGGFIFLKLKPLRK